MTFPGQDQPQSDGGDTANVQPWSSVLEGIPTQFHGDVTPALEKWHNEHQQKYQEVENKYGGWKPFIEQGVDPVQVQSAWGLAAALENDPVNTIKTIQQYYEQQGLSFTDQQATQIANKAVQQAVGDQNTAVDPRYDELKRNQDLMANIIVKNNNEKLAAEEDRKVAAEFDSLHKNMKQKYGTDFNEQFVGGLALATGMTLEQAAEAYYQEINSHVQQSHRPAPSVLGRGGGLPTNRPDVRQMNEQQMNDHALDIIRSMRQG